MFDLPEAKRVRREDLYSSASSRASSVASSTDGQDVEVADFEAKIHAQLAELYGPVPSGDRDVAHGLEGKNDGDDAAHHLDRRKSNGDHEDTAADAEDELQDDKAKEDIGFEFRLFSTSSSTTKPIQTDIQTQDEAQPPSATTPLAHAPAPRIILDDPDAPDIDGDGAFVRPNRDPSYYFAPPATGPRKAEFEAAAVTGSQILQAARTERYWAWEVPWRVTVLSVPGKRTKTQSESQSQSRSQQRQQQPEETKKKTKPNKKRRIILRIRKRKTEEGKEKRERDAKMKEELEREKRTRRNREKKVKRKEREKLKKKLGDGTAAGDPVGEGEMDVA